MSEPRMTGEEFFELWNKEHPLAPDSSATEWFNALVDAARAYQRYDPVGYAAAQHVALK